MKGGPFWLLTAFMLVGCRSIEEPEVFDPPQNGLVRYYSFDTVQNDGIPDLSGRGGNAVLHGGVRRSANGRLGGALSVDGEAESFAEDAFAYLSLNGLEAVSVALWVKSNVTGTDGGFLIGESPQGHDRALSLRYDAEGARSGGVNAIKGGVTVAGRGQTNFETLSDLQTTSWQHLTMTWANGRGFQLYVNAERVSLPYNPFVSGSIDSMTTLIIGKGSKDAEASWNGLIDELLIYERVLTREEIGFLFSAGSL